MRKKVLVSPGLYRCEASGTYFTRPQVDGRRTWRRTRIPAKPSLVSTMRELIAAYRAAGTPTARGRSRKSADMEGRNLTKLEPYFGDCDPQSVTQIDVMEYGRSRAAVPRAADSELQTLSNAFNWGLQNGLVSANPIRNRVRVQDPSEVVHSREVMPASGDELHRIAAELFSRPLSQSVAWQMIFEAFTGCRTNEVLGLRMDAKGKMDPGYVEGDYLYVRRSKSGQFPYVPIHGALRTALEWHRQWHAYTYPSSPWYFPGRDLVRPLGRTALTIRLSSVCRRLKLPHRTSHGMRAFFVSVMRSRGTSDEQVAALIGDRTVSLIQSTYGTLPEVWAGGEPLDFMPRHAAPAWKSLSGCDTKCPTMEAKAA